MPYFWYSYLKYDLGVLTVGPKYLELGVLTLNTIVLCIILYYYYIYAYCLVMRCDRIELFNWFYFQVKIGKIECKKVDNIFHPILPIFTYFHQKIKLT